MKTLIFALLVAFSALPSANSVAGDTPPTPSKAKPATETAVLAGGCFWGMEEFFRKQTGVLSTRVGYAGGHTESPTYEQSSSGTTGHAESVEIVFDPKTISYTKLLELFFTMHDPTTANRQGNDVGTQYRSAIFTTSDAQKTAAEAVKKRAGTAWKATITTEIAPLKKFYPAEDYHQKYLVKNPGGYDNHYVRKITI